MSRFSVLAIAAVMLPAASAQTMKTAHIQTTYSGIEERWARAMTETLEVARSVYIEGFGFDMPDQIAFHAECDAKLKTELFTNGQGVFFHLASPGDLNKPSVSHFFNIFGMCHELGHIAMMRALGSPQWLQREAGEDWAVYTGSVVVDRVYEKKGEFLWPDRYDYRSDGLARLQEMEKGHPASGVAMWHGIGRVIGNKGFPRLFQAWQAASVDAADPLARLGDMLCEVDPAHEANLRELWKTGGRLIVAAVRHDMVHLGAKLMESYPGRYQFPGGQVVAITREGERLFIQQLDDPQPQQPNHPKVEMFAETEREFSVRFLDIRINLEIDPQGRVTSLLLHKDGQDNRASRME